MHSLAEQPRAALHTLGCRLNQYETKLIRDKLELAGFRIVPFDQPADLGVINTCTVTNQADGKSRAEIRKFIRRNPKARTVVVGCYSQMGYKAISQIEGVDVIIGNQDKLNVLDYLPEEKAETPIIVRDRIDRTDFTINYVGDLPFTQRANLKVQDGCDFVCSFCIIPQARGRARARDFANVLEEARALVERGVGELVITGVNIGTYENSGKSFLDLMDALDAIPGVNRIRISSIEPTTIPEKLFDRMNDPAHAVLPYLHIPLQSGSDAVLTHMRRRYSLQEYVDFINMAESRVRDLCIGTDILVGYPTETEAHFEETCQTFLNNPFAYCHVFTFSERDGTRAGPIPQSEQVPTQERNRRSAHLRRLSAKKRHDYYSAHVGQTLPVLFENPREDTWPGYTDNYIRVVAKDSRDLKNKMAQVRLEGVSADFVEGTVVALL
ncbi:MAG: tRNA (N(6)-L-threonylcarbamoyladenosine(37)-C(2))-methylthiotransferase MtaB [Opitutales bacterium]|nr:tRNA (N(6)-L-threonylcarbamoyladenosine(37)-C(2))-methylthiotransferase MtaB [Opitutales bacterium]NRA26207.1 tRNA (N(6)-L-threonylcarbamoyladenosine(37)-C(2))-methylthiotransferase MtaB [Opitutales bacterium]